MSGRDRAVQPDATRRYSPAQASFFRAYFARFFRKHMNALRLADPERARRLAEVDGPIVVYTNHPGWWDGALYVVLPKLCFPTRRAYAPIEAGMMTKYGFFERIGGFGVDLGTARGAAAFLRQSDRILARSDSLLWISVQGQFADVRQRPLGIKAGIAHVCERAPRATVSRPRSTTSSGLSEGRKRWYDSASLCVRVSSSRWSARSGSRISKTASLTRWTGSPPMQ